MLRPFLALAASLVVAATNIARAEDQPSVPTFTALADSGIDHTFAGEWEFMVGGGAAVFDCDGNGLQDVFLTGGENPSALYRNVSAAGGALRFAKVDGGPAPEKASGAYPLDSDSDGAMDLVILRVGPNMILRGLGDCRFEDKTGDWGFDGGDAWSTAFAATWEKGATWPTLAIGNYIDRREEFSPWGSCTENWLHRPTPEGREGFAPPLPLTPSYCALSLLFTDWNRSGTPALRVSNDREYYEGGQEQMWHIPPGAPPALFTAKDGWQVLKIWGMGIASADIDGNGYPDYFLTSMADNKLQVLTEAGPDAKPVFKDIAFARGVTAHRPYTGGDPRPSTAWHAQFDDVNNDGLVDLFVAKGNVTAMPDFAAKDPNNLLLQKADGTFAEVGDKAGIASLETARGAALADFNADGLLDLIVVNRNAPTEIWQNGGPAGHWLELLPRQEGVNRDAIGGWIEVRLGEQVQRREITSGGGHAGGQAGWWHFGLGAAEAGEARILWPDGREGPWQSVRADQRYILSPDRAPESWPAK
jgi:hypothetical protein